MGEVREFALLNPIIGLRFIITKVWLTDMFLNDCYFTNICVYVPMFLTCLYLHSLLESLCILYSLWSKSNSRYLFVDTDTSCASVLCVLSLYKYNKVCKPQPTIVEDSVAIRAERRPLFIVEDSVAIRAEKRPLFIVEDNVAIRAEKRPLFTTLLLKPSQTPPLTPKQL